MFPYIFYIFHKYLNNEYSLEGLRTQDSLFILQSSFQGTSNSIQIKTKSYDTYKFHALNHTTFQPEYWSMTHRPSWTPILVTDTYFIHCMPHLQQNQGKTLVSVPNHPSFYSLLSCQAHSCIFSWKLWISSHFDDWSTDQNKTCLQESLCQ